MFEVIGSLYYITNTRDFNFVDLSELKTSYAIYRLKLRGVEQGGEQFELSAA